MKYNNTPPNEQSSGIFFCGFIEANVELPPDGLNGDCIVHYSGQHANYSMKVKLLNGIREGDAVLLNNGIPYLKLVYKNGVLTGTVERFNQIGIIDLKGQLVNGIETGLFTEYDDNKIVWRGYYRNGVRYSVLTKSDTLDGYYDERSVSSNSLLTTAQYDDSLHDKNGRCFEYENGQLKRMCLVENGEIIQTLQASELHDMILSKRIDSRVMNFVHSSFFVSDVASGDTVGYFQLNREFFSVDLSEDTFHVIKVDMDSKDMTVYVNDKWNAITFTKEVIDLNANGKRWEGSVRNGKPFGFGVFYDEEGRKEFEGFMVNGIITGYGIEYYGDIERVKYEG